MIPLTIDELFSTAAGDGGSMPVGPKPMRLDMNGILQAWTIERGHSIECEMLLSLTRAVLLRMQANNQAQSWPDRQDTEDLIQQIEWRLRRSPQDHS